MQEKGATVSNTIHGFFLLSLGRLSLGMYYKMTFNLKQRYGWELETVNNLMPWELEIYIDLLNEYKQKENQE